MIAAITSCTNTSNPQVMVAAGLLAKKAVERGLDRKPWVKSSLAPGSRVVTDYYEKAGLTPYLEALGFHTVGYGCTTCIGNSGPLPEEISAAIAETDLVVCAVLSGNRNFEARIHPEVKANYLASPPLVVAYALAGRMDLDLNTEPIGQDPDGNDVFLRDLWPTRDEIDETIAGSVSGDLFRGRYADVFTGDETLGRARGAERRPLRLGRRLDLRAPAALLRRHVGRARDGRGLRRRPLPRHARRLGDDRPHLAGRLDQAGRPGRAVPGRARRRAQGVQLVRLPARQPRGDGARDVRERAPAQPARPGSEGTWTVHLPSGEEMSIFDVVGALPAPRARR